MFDFNVMSDKELDKLANAIREEVERRAQEKARLREEWVFKMLLRYLAHPNATHMTLGVVTVVSVYKRDSGIRLGKATCLPGDEYDENTGVAVAFAKATGESVPYFI